MDDQTWVRDAQSLSYDSAQHNRFYVGAWTADQWEAYDIAWQHGAPRFGSSVYPIDPVNGHVATLALELLAECSSYWQPASMWPRAELSDAAVDQIIADVLDGGE